MVLPIAAANGNHYSATELARNIDWMLVSGRYQQITIDVTMQWVFRPDFNQAALNNDFKGIEEAIKQGVVPVWVKVEWKWFNSLKTNCDYNTFIKPEKPLIANTTVKDQTWRMKNPLISSKEDILRIIELKRIRWARKFKPL